MATDHQRRVAALLCLDPDRPELWPMGLVDWLLRVEQHEGWAGLSRELQKLITPPFAPPSDRYAEGRRAGLEQAAQCVEAQAGQVESVRRYLAAEIRKLADRTEGGDAEDGG